ncbi:conjugative coupling factor TraD, PFGI-1 class [Leclercia adecarboxylata]|uniref:Conjugative coupling factor TraD, PFGI-1 class n=1 Tax=Leclercia adecarboxylata TaxID=83655 RepID=A0A4U9IPQ5_9ENTR|nr:conjugative coupling factor TraD, PFGI-1 class [Leclercia adecarboxylata]
MSNRYVIEALLRPAVELNTAVVSGMAAYVCVQAPWAVALAPSVSYVTAAGFAALAVTPHASGDEDYSLPPESPPPAALCHEH